MNKTQGFTLIELLVVVLIIGILSAIALPQYTKAVEKTRAMEAVVAVKAIKDAQEVYHMANGVYADSVDDLDIKVDTQLNNFQLDTTYPLSAGRYAYFNTKEKYFIIGSGHYRSSTDPVDIIYCCNSSNKNNICAVIGTEKITLGSCSNAWRI